MFLETKNLTKKFGGLVAVNNVDFSIEKGKINAIIGPNGAGKSTFFNLISGFHPPSSGQVIFKGKDITKLPSNKIAELGVARTFQTTNLFDQATVLDNVIVGHRLRTKSNLADAIFRTKRLKREEKQCRDKAIEVLEFVGLTSTAYKLAGSLSQEEKKRVAFALALATEPEIMLFDEPTSALDPIATMNIEELMSELKQKLSILIVTHNMQQAARISDYTAYMYLGELVEFDGTNQIFTNPSKKETEDYITGKFG